MTVNEPLLRQTVEYIENNPREWDQNHYIMDDDSFCGTTRCLAGTAIMLHFGLTTERQQNDFVLKNYPVDSGNSFSKCGSEILGLDEHQAERIFHCYTSNIDKLKDRITEITGVEFKSDG